METERRQVFAALLMIQGVERTYKLEEMDGLEIYKKASVTP